jgi:hypothetical protein
MNINYLGHLFEIADGNFVYKCEKCKILVWNSGIDKECNDWWLLNNELYHIGVKLNLTCDEAIIKDIIE